MFFQKTVLLAQYTATLISFNNKRSIYSCNEAAGIKRLMFFYGTIVTMIIEPHKNSRASTKNNFSFLLKQKKLHISFMQF